MAETLIATGKIPQGYSVLQTAGLGLGIAMSISGSICVADLGADYIRNDQPSLSAPLLDPDEAHARFRELAAAWKTAVRSASSSTVAEMVRDPNYQQIIKMGPAVVPSLLREMAERPDHWSVALEKITGENPVPPEAAGKLKAIARAWLDWGGARRFV
jgi:hypothetical protein